MSHDNKYKFIVCCFGYSGLEHSHVIDHFTVVSSVTWPLNGNESGGDLVLIQTSLLLLCKLGALI